MLFASQLNCFTQLRALLVLHDRGKDSLFLLHEIAVSYLANRSPVSEHSGNIQGTFRGSSGDIRGTFN
jgi:hypothetical protein